MTAEIETLLRFLDGADHIARDAPRPDNADDAEDVLASVHQLMTTTEGLHDEVAGCFGQIDSAGRCVDCGRLVALGMWRGHSEGPGCLMAVPLVGSVVWLINHRDGIPVVGNLIWRRRRANARRSAATDSTPGPTASGAGVDR